MKNHLQSGPREWITVPDVSKLTGLAMQTVYKLVRKKKIPYYKPNGGKLYFDKSEVDAWISNNRVESVNS